jgi:peptidoglycan hydrolase-like protein with peptidoglycan-binding domain
MRDRTTRSGRLLRRLAVATTGTLVLVASAGASYAVLTEDLTLSGLLPAPAPSAAGTASHAPRPTRPASDVPPVESPAPPTASSDPEPEPEPAPQPDPEPEPQPVLAPGDEGSQVRELQARLAQLAWFAPVTTGSYDAATRTAVSGFQAKRGFEATGVVDERTWRRLVRMSRPPTEAELFNRPGPTLLASGDQGRDVRELEARLRQIAWFFGDVDNTFDDQTREAVSGFQAKRGIPATGEVDQRTLDLLDAMTTEPTADALANRKPDPADGAPLDPRCSSGMALCIDKTSDSLRWVVDGKVAMSLDVRFGSAETPTREGLFSVYRKSRDHVSTLYHSSMPFAMFFSGGQAVHYSSDFAARGYYGASHGCVNVRDYSAIATLFDEVPLGTKVVVYRS